MTQGGAYVSCNTRVPGIRTETAGLSSAPSPARRIKVGADNPSRSPGSTADGLIDMQQLSTGNVASRPLAITPHRMRREVVGWLSREGCSHALTLATNRSLSVPKLTTMFGNFCFELDRACLGRRNVGQTPSEDRLFAAAFIEHPDTNIHLHVALRLDGWWQDRPPMTVDDRISVIWGSITGSAGSTLLRPIEDEGWGRYITKAANVRGGEYLLSADYHPKH